MMMGIKRRLPPVGAEVHNDEWDQDKLREEEAELLRAAGPIRHGPYDLVPWPITREMRVEGFMIRNSEKMAWLMVGFGGALVVEQGFHWYQVVPLFLSTAIIAGNMFVRWSARHDHVPLEYRAYRTPSRVDDESVNDDTHT